MTERLCPCDWTIGENCPDCYLEPSPTRYGRLRDKRYGNVNPARVFELRKAAVLRRYEVRLRQVAWDDGRYGAYDSVNRRVRRVEAMTYRGGR